jgi:hypothetical protein
VKQNKFPRIYCSSYYLGTLFASFVSYDWMDICLQPSSTEQMFLSALQFVVYENSTIGIPTRFPKM